MYESIAEFIARLRAKPKAVRELWLAGAALAFGLVVLPFLIYLAGTLTLGRYESGSVWGYLLDFLKGLIRPHPAYWLIVTGPYLLIALARGLWALRKRVHRGSGA